MMTKRYYYNCTIKASFMAKYHNVNFLNDLGATLYVQDDNTFSTFKDNGVYAGEKYYINPNCHDMLKPQVGDTLRDNANFAIIAPDHHEYRHADYITTKDYINKWHDAEIIQRKGKAFFTPECQEAE